MNSDAGIQIETAKVVQKVPRAPTVIQSALFVVLFFTATFLTVLGALYALSNDPSRTAKAYPILLFNLPLIGFVGIYLGTRVWFTLFSKRRRLSAPLLHRRFVLIFSLAALLPAILVGAFSTSLISRNINDLFGENVRGTIERSREFLDTYILDEARELNSKIQVTKGFLDGNASLFKQRISYTANLLRLTRSQGFDAVYVMSREGIILSRVEGIRAPIFEVPSASFFEQLDNTNTPSVQKKNEINYMVGAVKLDNYEDAYLYVGKYLRSQSPVLSNISAMDETSAALERFSKDQNLFNKIFYLTFLETAILITLAAIWLGFLLANRIIDPLGRLVYAAERIRSGDLSARVNVEGDWGEMTDLGGAFNRMSQQLRSQREDLIREHDISEQRRIFSEAVLSGVRAGVVGLSQEGKITLLNQSAERLLGVSSKHLLGQHVDDVLSEFSNAFRAARENISGTAEDQINYEAALGPRNFDLRVSAYQGGSLDTGWVLTFDDMTRLVAAQRHSAWREVARRIAHEIKNPLTPIQLSAERLQRKYANETIFDRDVFDNCTQTIIRQVSSLENMVDEFSAFARMPAPVLNAVDMIELLDQVLFAQGVAYPDIKLTFEPKSSGKIFVRCDERLISQALTNIYKNAAESIGRRLDASGEGEQDGLILTDINIVEDMVVISISDNGLGWPFPDKDRLLEPYVTTRDTGTGLGLAIVKRIAEDHGGNLVLRDRDDNDFGAMLQLYLPQDTSQSQAKNSTTESNPSL